MKTMIFVLLMMISYQSQAVCYGIGEITGTSTVQNCNFEPDFETAKQVAIEKGKQACLPTGAWPYNEFTYETTCVDDQLITKAKAQFRCCGDLW